MLDFLSPDDDAIAILKSDHSQVKKLFDQFEETENLNEKARIAEQAIQELKIHTVIEEEIFYPTVRRKVEGKIMNEADEEHHVAKLLIAELEQLDKTDQHYVAKFTVLAESVRHHIREEENRMMPEARGMDIDFTALGQQLLERKRELKENGIPASAEEKLMARTGAKDDSPAQAAKTASRTKRPAPGKASKGKSARTSYTSGSRMPARKSQKRRRNS